MCEDSKQMGRKMFLTVSLKIVKYKVPFCSSSCAHTAVFRLQSNMKSNFSPSYTAANLIASLASYGKQTYTAAGGMVPVGERWQLIIIGLPLPCPSFHIPSRGAAWETVKAGSPLPDCESCKGTVHPPLQEEWSVEKQNTLSDIPTCSRKQEHPGGRSVTNTFSERSTWPPCLRKFRGNSFLKPLFI